MLLGWAERPRPRSFDARVRLQAASGWTEQFGHVGALTHAGLVGEEHPSVGMCDVVSGFFNRFAVAIECAYDM